MRIAARKGLDPERAPYGEERPVSLNRCARWYFHLLGLLWLAAVLFYLLVAKHWDSHFSVSIQIFTLALTPVLCSIMGRVDRGNGRWEFLVWPILVIGSDYLVTAGELASYWGWHRFWYILGRRLLAASWRYRLYGGACIGLYLLFRTAGRPLGSRRQGRAMGEAVRNRKGE
jgi:hypothetical protein